MSSNFSLHDLSIGSVIVDGDSKFVIAGISLYDYLLVTLYTDQEIDKEVLQSGSFLSLRVNFIRNESNHNRYFADCSKVMIRQFSMLNTWLRNNANVLAGQVEEDDIFVLKRELKNATTLSPILKKEFRF